MERWLVHFLKLHDPISRRWIGGKALQQQATEGISMLQDIRNVICGLFSIPKSIWRRGLSLSLSVAVFQS